MSNRVLLVVDGSSYLYRAFHALPPLEAPDGRPTGAIYGVVNMLNRLQRDEQPTRVAVVFDAPGPTFRDRLYAAYKANRAAMPEDLSAQIDPLLELIEALGLPLLRVSGVEADDVIATLVRHHTDLGEQVVIASGDKDLAQLVDNGIVLVDTMHGTRMGRAGVEMKFGVPPERIVDLLALMGDSSDNIPGIPGIGPKTAAKWLSEYGDLEALRAHANEIQGKAGERLREYLPGLDLSMRLATVRDNLDLRITPETLTPRAPDIGRLRKIYADLGFKRWLGELSRADTSMPIRNYTLVENREEMELWLEKARSAELFAFDLETTGLNYLEARIIGIALAVAPGDAAYIPLAHTQARPLDRDEVLMRFKPLWENPVYPKLGHHLKYDAHVLANHGIHLAGIHHDTLLESYVLDPTAGRHDLDSLAARVLEERTITYEEVAGKGAKQIGFAEVPLERAGVYAAEDADVTWRLHQALWPKLRQVPALQAVYEEIEIPLVPVLLSMERHGVLIDGERLKIQSRELAQRMEQVQAEAWRVAGREFNLDSPAQLAVVLFTDLRLPVIRKTPKGQPSTAESVLGELAAKHPLPQRILDYRSLAKLRSTYTEKLPASVHPGTGRVHTMYNQSGTSTGRLSSSEPNLQNIPIRTAEGRKIRRAFIAPKGWNIVAADYSQIELRIMAHLSGDAGLRRAFAERQDIHRATAAEVFSRRLEAVGAAERRAAKAINFGLIYGMSSFGLARQLGIGREEAQEYIDRYFERYPGVRDYMHATRRRAKREGYVETIFGRRLYVPEIRSRNAHRRQGAERAAINAPMQGSAADIIKRAMIAIHAWCAGEDSGVDLVMQVHDELVFEVAAARLESAVIEIREKMESAANLTVPLVVEIGVGANWDEAH